MAAAGTTLSPNKAHRVSRHVSFQAVVPPAVSFPVNYFGPSLMQASNQRTSIVRQSLADSQISDSSLEDFKSRTGRQMSTVIALDSTRNSTDGSIPNANSPLNKLRNKFTFISVPKKSSYFKSLRFNCKKKKYLLIASGFLFCIVLILVVIAVSITTTINHVNPAELQRNNIQPSEICENPACLRIGLFFQTALSDVNKKGLEDTCSDFSVRTLVEIIWARLDGSDIILKSPFAAAVEIIMQENLKLESCSYSNANSNIRNQTLNDLNPMDKSIARMLHDLTLTFTSFDEVLYTVHIQYQISLFFKVRNDGNLVEISASERFQPWENFNLRRVHSRSAKELQTYICSVLKYAQSIGVISNFNSSDNCNHFDNDRVHAVYEILQMLQEVKMMGEAHNTWPDRMDCQSMTMIELNAIAQNTIDFSILLRNFPNETRVRMCNVDVIQGIAEIIRQTRSSDLQDFIFFFVLNEIGARYSMVVANAKYRLLSFAFGNIGFPNEAVCVLQFGVSQMELQKLSDKLNEYETFLTTVNEELFTLLKRTYENYFKQSQSVVDLINEMNLNKLGESNESYKPHENKAQRLNESSELIDVGLHTYGSQMVRFDWNNKKLEPSLLLGFEERIYPHDLHSRVTTYAFLGYWLSMSFADVIFKFAGDYETMDFPEAVRPLFKCILSNFHRAEDHFYATDYMEHLLIMKRALAVEMLTRTYLESKGNRPYSRISGVYLPEDQVFYLMLIQTLCAKPPYSDIRLTDICERALLAIQLSPTFMSLVDCSPSRYVFFNFSDNSDSPITRIMPSTCFP